MIGCRTGSHHDLLSCSLPTLCGLIIFHGTYQSLLYELFGKRARLTYSRPRLRDRLVTSQPPVSFENFFIPFTTTISLNWPYEPRDCLLPASKVHTHTLSTASSVSVSSPFSTHVNAGSPQDPSTPQPPAANKSAGITSIGPLPKEDDQWLINPAFETHLRDLNNWTLGPSFRGNFPAFADCVKIKEGR